MQQSDSIKEIAAALAKAQGEIKGAVKDSTNPHFKSKYADLASVWDACRAALSKNGLAVFQTTETTADGIFLVTTLAHSSGEWMRGTFPVQPVQNTPQGLGSAMTYARRYSLAAMVGVAPEDDDGQAASEGTPQTQARTNGNGAAKTAAPKQTAEPDPLREAFVRIREAISKAKTVKAVDDILTNSATDLNAIRDKSYAAYEQLAHAAENRKADLSPIAA
jgi:hypothetical protein